MKNWQFVIISLLLSAIFVILTATYFEIKSRRNNIDTIRVKTALIDKTLTDVKTEISQIKIPVKMIYNKIY